MPAEKQVHNTTVVLSSSSLSVIDFIECPTKTRNDCTLGKITI